MTGRIIVTPFNTDTIISKPLIVKDDLITGYNIAPRNFVSIIKQGRHEIELCKAYWGYTPHWLKVLENSPYLARCETLQDKAMFKKSLQQRCLIPVSGYYEWKQFTRQKQAYAVRRPENRIFFLAGIWTRYPTSDVTYYETFALLTIKSNRFIHNISERMPVVITEESVEEWLNSDNLDKPESFLKPAAEQHLDYYPVSALVNNPDNGSRAVSEPNSKRFRFEQ